MFLNWIETNLWRAACIVLTAVILSLIIHIAGFPLISKGLNGEIKALEKTVTRKNEALKKAADALRRSQVEIEKAQAQIDEQNAAIIVYEGAVGRAEDKAERARNNAVRREREADRQIDRIRSQPSRDCRTSEAVRNAEL